MDNCSFSLTLSLWQILNTHQSLPSFITYKRPHNTYTLIPLCCYHHSIYIYLQPSSLSQCISLPYFFLLTSYPLPLFLLIYSHLLPFYPSVSFCFPFFFPNICWPYIHSTLLIDMFLSDIGTWKWYHGQITAKWSVFFFYLCCFRYRDGWGWAYCVFSFVSGFVGLDLEV